MKAGFYLQDGKFLLMNVKIVTRFFFLLILIKIGGMQTELIFIWRGGGRRSNTNSVVPSRRRICNQILY